MIETLEVFTPSVLVAPLPIGDGKPATDPIQILDITGLEPVKSNILTTPYGSVDGASYDGANTPERNIVLTVRLNPSWGSQTIEGLRAILYTYFMPQMFVRLRFTSTHMATVEITGYVESFEPTLFGKDALAQISIVCPQPYFTAVDETVVNGVTEDISGTTPVVVDYQGNVATGFVVQVRNHTSTTFAGETRIVSMSPSTRLFSVTATINNGNYLEISTVERDKYAQTILNSNAAVTNVLGKVLPGSVWLPIITGQNQLQVLTATAGMDFTVRYFAKYGGL